MCFSERSSTGRRERQYCIRGIRRIPSVVYTQQYLYFPRRVCHLFSSRLVWKGHRENSRPVAYVLGKGGLRILSVVRVEVSERDGHARSGRPGPRDGRDGIAVDFMSAIFVMMMPTSSSLEDDFGRREQRPRRRRRHQRDDDDHLVRSRIKHTTEKSFP